MPYLAKSDTQAAGKSDVVLNIAIFVFGFSLIILENVSKIVSGIVGSEVKKSPFKVLLS
jgi:uncharacterized protein (UPF0210 family)